MNRQSPRPGFGRRRFLATLGAVAAAPAFSRATALPAGASPDLPPAADLQPLTFLNWSGEIRIPDAWTASPRDAAEAASLAQWALEHGWRLRPRGMGHGWSPLLAASGRPLPPSLLVDFTKHMDGIQVEGAAGARTVTAQAGASLDRLWEVLGEAGLAVAATPAPGNLTLGGALAIGAHGTFLETPGALAQGWVPGSLCNAVVALEALVWDGGAFRPRTFRRDEAAIAPLLVHAGRAVITSATLQVGADVNLRCRSFTDIPAAELFAPPALAGPRSFQALALAAGRVESTWFPGTEAPWLRVWSAAPDKPPESRALEGPYPFTFANWVSREASDATAALLRAYPSKTPAFLGLEMALAQAGLEAWGARDVWGPSRFSTLHVQPSTLRYHVSGHAILCRSADIQRVVSEFHGAFRDLLEAYRARGLYPINGPLDLRLTGLDRPPSPGAQEALLSPIRPHPAHPEWDCAVWAEVLTLPGTPGAMRFYADLEAWMLGNYQGGYALVRAEWSKGWAYTPRGAWTADAVLDGHIPGTFTEGFAAEGTWDAAAARLRAWDPEGVFASPILDRLFRISRPRP